MTDPRAPRPRGDRGDEPSIIGAGCGGSSLLPDEAARLAALHSWAADKFELDPQTIRSNAIWLLELVDTLRQQLAEAADARRAAEESEARFREEYLTHHQHLTEAEAERDRLKVDRDWWKTDRDAYRTKLEALTTALAALVERMENDINNWGDDHVGGGPLRYWHGKLAALLAPTQTEETP